MADGARRAASSELDGAISGHALQERWQIGSTPNRDLRSLMNLTRSAAGGRASRLRQQRGALSRHARSQGGTLDLHPESGQYALEAAGLAEQFHALARSEGEEHKIMSPSGDLLVHHVPDAPGGRPEIDRTDLRDLLTGSLPAATIHWDAQVVAIEEGAGSGFRLGLADGTTSECDLLVGADGGGSLLRSRLTDAATAYLSSYTQMSIPDVDRTRPDLARLVGHGSLWALGRDQNLTAQRESSGLVRVSAMVRSARPWRQAGRSAVLQRYADWSPTLTALVEAADEPVVSRDIRVTPPGMRWPSHPSLTLVGDAAHLMPPVRTTQVPNRPLPVTARACPAWRLPLIGGGESGSSR